MTLIKQDPLRLRDIAAGSAIKNGHGNQGQLFEQLGDDESTLRDLMRLVEKELRRAAQQQRRRCLLRPTMETTELVSECYVRLFGGQIPRIETHQHFFNLAGQTMRWILVKRFGRARLDLLENPDEILQIEPDKAPLDLLVLNDALEELHKLDSDLADLVDKKFFLGLEMKEIALVTGVSESTLFRRWRCAKRWLHYRLTRGEQSE